MCVVNILNSVNATPTVKIVLNKGKQIWKPKGKLSENSLNKTKQVWKATGKLFANVGYQWRSTRKKVALGKLNYGYQWRPTRNKFALGELCPLTRLSVQCCSKHITGNRSKLKNFVEKFIGTVRFGNDHFGAIMGYGEYVIGDSVISRVYYVEGLGHNLFFVEQFCDSDLEVAFRKHFCFVCDINGADLLKGSRSTNLYTISIDDMMKSSPICLLSKASKSKSWLWHRRLNHLNFGTINDLAQKDLVRGLPRLKFEKDHLCSACQLGKSKKFSHKPKSENTNMEVLHTLHMDLCGPMRVQSIKGKKYILVIVDDYSRFTWVKFLRSKDETPEFVINFLKQIQVGLNKTVRYIRTDNGMEFVNQVMSKYYEGVGIFCRNQDLDSTRVGLNKTVRYIRTDNGTEIVNQVMSKYYEGVGIFHQKSVPKTPQQNGVVERRNRTLVEAARTMLIFSKALMFLWAEAVSTAYAPSTSHSLSSSQVHPLVFPQGVAAGPTIKDTSITQADLHPSVNPFTGEPSYAQSTSGGVSLAEPNQVNQPPDPLRKWTKDHPLDNIIGNPSRPCNWVLEKQKKLRNQIFRALTALADVPSSVTETTDTTSTLPPPPPPLQKPNRWIKASQDETTGPSVHPEDATSIKMVRETLSHADAESGGNSEKINSETDTEILNVGSNSEQSHVALAGPNPEHMHDVFLATNYPKCNRVSERQTKLRNQIFRALAASADVPSSVIETTDTTSTLQPPRPLLQTYSSSRYLDHLKMEMEMEIPSSSNVKLITECSDTTYTCYEVMKDLIKVSKLPQTLISYSSSQATRHETRGHTGTATYAEPGKPDLPILTMPRPEPDPPVGLRQPPLTGGPAVVNGGPPPLTVVDRHRWTPLTGEASGRLRGDLLLAYWGINELAGAVSPRSGALIGGWLEMTKLPLPLGGYIITRTAAIGGLDLVTLIASSSKSSSTKGDVLEGGGVSSNVTLSDSSTFMVPIVPVEPVITQEVGAVQVVSPTRALDLVDYSSSSDSDPSEDSLSPAPDFPLVLPFLCSDDSEADGESEPTEQRPVLSFYDTIAPLLEFSLAPVVTPLGIRRRPTILVRPGEAPFGRPYRTHLNGPRKLLTARKRVRPILARRLTWRQRSAPLSIPYPPTTSESSLGSSSERSLDSSSPSSGPSRKRCRSPTASVPSPTHVLRSIAPTIADILPPCKRFRDSYSLEDSGEEHMEVDTADAEAVADIGISDGVVAYPEDSIGMRVEIAASDFREDDEEFEAEASAADTREIAIDPLAIGDSSESSRGGNLDLEDTTYDIVHYMLEVRIDRITKIESTQRQLEASQLVASRERASLVERIGSLRLEYLKVGAMLSIERDRIDSLR
ncbi:retrovirus-related pol polyprotein from transposon TNT 1-94 [Tanacetum coccineum]